jgi:hypothetical protein
MHQLEKFGYTPADELHVVTVTAALFAFEDAVKQRETLAPGWK